MVNLMNFLTLTDLFQNKFETLNIQLNFNENNIIHF